MFVNRLKSPKFGWRTTKGFTKIKKVNIITFFRINSNLYKKVIPFNIVSCWNGISSFSQNEDVQQKLNENKIVKISTIINIIIIDKFNLSIWLNATDISIFWPSISPSFKWYLLKNSSYIFCPSVEKEFSK